MGVSIKVENRDPRWPDWLVRWIVRRACADAGVRKYSWVQKERTSPGGGGWGRGGPSSGYGGCGRRSLLARYATVLVRDPRFKRAPAYRLPSSPVAELAFLIRHEAGHARGAEGDPARPEYRRADGRQDDRAMEDACNDAASRFVLRLGASMADVRAEWMALARADRARTKARAARRAAVDRTARTRAAHAAKAVEWAARAEALARSAKAAAKRATRYRGLARAAERRMAARPKDSSPKSPPSA